jgi:ADP-heptose:LPS heptosyltransferase
MKSVGWRRSIFEGFVNLNRLFAPQASEQPKQPETIFVLRNNDIGDLLAVTPLFEALKKRFPNAKILVGIGRWNREVLITNPYVTKIVELNAPWHNYSIGNQGISSALRYIYQSAEVKALKECRADIGIDVLGSGFGSLLMMQAQIPYRFGVYGYAGGNSAAQRCVRFRPDEHVGRQALRFAELLGCTDLPENRPQIFLDKPPEPHGAIVIAPGAGLPEKCWPIEYFAELARLLNDSDITITGSKNDAPLAAQILNKNSNARDFTGRLRLREAFAMIAGAKLVISNSSMAMHAAAAFRRPAVVVLGQVFKSAAEHCRQWGYPETVVLGRGENRDRIFTPEEVAAKVRQMCS